MLDVLFSSAWTTVATLTGAAGGVVGAWYSWRSFRISKIGISRNIDVRLWRHGNRTIEVQIALMNSGRTTALIDQVRVIGPRGTKVAWHKEPNAYTGGRSTLKDETCSNVHDLRLLVEPGSVGTVGFVMELPLPIERVPLLKMRARVSANDFVRRYVWMAFTAKPTMATDQRAINKSILGIPEDRYP